MNKKKNGLYEKYNLRHNDGSAVSDDAIYFVLRLDTDWCARAAVQTYIASCRHEMPELAGDLQKLLNKIRAS